MDYLKEIFKDYKIISNYNHKKITNPFNNEHFSFIDFFNYDKL